MDGVSWPAGLRPPEQTGRDTAEAGRALAVLGLFLLCGWSAFKGVMFGFHGSENYFWITTYAQGFVRRGLVGTLLSPWLGHADLEQVKTVVLALNRAGLGLLTMLLLLAVARQTRRWREAAVLAAVFAVAPFLGQTAFLVGFPDGMLALMLALLIGAAWYGSLAVFLLVCAVAALLHEFVPLVALPCVGLAACLRQGMGARGRLAMVAATAAAVFGMGLAGHAPAAAVQALTAHLIRLGDDPAYALHQAQWRLTQSSGEDFAMVREVWGVWWVNGLIGLAYAATPAVVLCVLGWPRFRAALARARAAQPWLEGRKWGAALAVLYLAACFGPLAVLLIAIDLSRLAGFTLVTTLLTLLMLPPAPLPRFGRGLAAATLAAFVLLPVYSMHLQYASASRLRLLAPVCPGCARGFVEALNFYNRGQSQAQRDEVLTNPAYLNAR